MTFKNTVMYQIYPLGYCGAEPINDFGGTRHRLDAITARIGQIGELGVNAVLLNPLLSSSAHGYDTADFFRPDERLGSADDVKAMIAAFHAAGMRVVFDGVFNHVGRDFTAFRDVRLHREQSEFRDWFHIDFNGNTEYNDGFWYEPWEGHYELVKLNLENPAVQEHIFSAVRAWIDWGIDGLRLDVAYLLPIWFLELLRQKVESFKPGFYLVGEMIHGDYGRLIGPEKLDSVTDYECYKGLYSALNSHNLFEIEHSLTRLFGNEPWALCRGKGLLNFVDNHDVTRIASILRDKRMLAAAYAVLFTMPGTPCLYYGSEWGQEGNKSDGDRALRPAADACDTAAAPALKELISKLARIKRTEAALEGDYRKAYLSNTALAFARGGEIWTVVNIAEQAQDIKLDGRFRSLLSGEIFDNALTAAPFCADVLKRI